MTAKSAKKGSGDDARLCLLTGATGYVGGRLLKAFEARGQPLRCLARRPDFLRPRVSASTEIVAGDVLEPDSLASALRDVRVAYYLIHSMGSKQSFEEQDREAARNFAAAAAAAGVERIIYLGGLGNADENLSAHLRSRQEVGRVLAQSGVPVLEFRASIVIGSGSLSFEMIRSLVERLPVMITPKWVSMPAQPIAVDDLIAYLLAGLDLPPDQIGVYEIGGADQVSYAEIMRVYARCRQARIRMIPMPVLTPYLSSLWLGLVTPVYARIGRKLIESIVHATVVRDHRALEVFSIQPMGIEAAVRLALANEDKKFAESRWSDALSSAGRLPNRQDRRYGTRLVDVRKTEVARPPEIAFAPIRRIGGDRGWYAWNWLWRLRGFLDLLVGGVGMRRGRPETGTLRVGDPLDFWRVEVYEPGRVLRLAADMKLPGRAWLEFRVEGNGDGSTIHQTAVFDPVGFWGRMYWLAVLPLHHLVFGGMLRGIVDAATREPADGEPERDGPR